MSIQELFRFRVHSSVFLPFLCFFLTYSSLGLAQSIQADIEQEPDAIKYAQEMITQGQNLLKEKRYREALPFFERSQRRVPDVKNLYTMGAISIKLNDCPQALSYWMEAQQSCRACGLSSQIDQALMKHTRACSTEISIQSLPRSIVVIDNKEIGETPYLSRILVGTHTLQLKANAHQTYDMRFQASASRSVDIDVVLLPLGQQLGIQDPAKSLLETPSSFNSTFQARPNSNLQPPPSTLSAADWLNTEALDNQTYSRQTQMKKILIKAGIALGTGALALYGYSTYKYFDLKDQSKRNSKADISLYNQAQQAKLMQTGAVALTVLSSLSFVSFWFVK